MDQETLKLSVDQNALRALIAPLHMHEDEFELEICVQVIAINIELANKHQRYEHLCDALVGTIENFVFNDNPSSEHMDALVRFVNDVLKLVPAAREVCMPLIAQSFPGLVPKFFSNEDTIARECNAANDA